MHEFENKEGNNKSWGKVMISFDGLQLLFEYEQSLERLTGVFACSKFFGGTGGVEGVISLDDMII